MRQRGYHILVGTIIVVVVTVGIVMVLLRFPEKGEVSLLSGIDFLASAWIIILALILYYAFDMKNRDEQLREHWKSLRVIQKGLQKGSKTLYYRSIPSYTEGIYSITILTGERRYSLLVKWLKNKNYLDSKALRSDWDEVGLDITRSMKQYSDWLIAFHRDLDQENQISEAVGQSITNNDNDTFGKLLEAFIDDMENKSSKYETASN